MSGTVTLEEAQAHLSELIASLAPGDEVLITHNAQPIARLVGERAAPRAPRRPGNAQGKLIIHAEDDEHLADFEEYLP
jgi:prevent-host-death family protein